MKAVLQNFRNGQLSVSEIPPPVSRSGGVIVATSASLISAGTERAVIELARMNPLRKARSRPDLVRKVLDRAAQEGLLGTARIVLNLLDTPVPLGYSCAGTVRQVGEGVHTFGVGDRVACAGVGFANHAEVVWVPKNLTVKVPDGVSHEEAAFAAVGAIALHAVRQADLAIGANVGVIGLGLVGQLVTQLCAANGCRVFGFDLDETRLKTALDGGAAEARFPDHRAPAAVLRFTDGLGLDAVIVAAATKSSSAAALAAAIARDRARVVALGDVGLDLPRRAYYEKELELRLSRSTGPGRYDRTYEEKGVDYPAGYVRWTENRNMSAFLELVRQKKVDVRPLISHRFPVARAVDAYELLTGREPSLGILLEYPHSDTVPVSVVLRPEPKPRASGSRTVRLGVIGAGQFAQGILLPAIRRRSDVEIVGVATATGITARTVADRYGARICTSDYRELIAAPDIDSLLVATRHQLHARIAIEAVHSGKNVFVEKPLAIARSELAELLDCVQKAPRPILFVGFNRRYSPLAMRLKESIGEGPLVINYRINAGRLPDDSWILDPEVGGGRIVGEICHFVDLMQFLTDAAPVEVTGLHTRSPSRAEPADLQFLLRFDDGSTASITYASNGDPRFPKERVEVFGGGAVGLIDNWRRLLVQGKGRKVRKRSWLSSQKGHDEELAAFVGAVCSGEQPVPVTSYALTTMCTFAMQDSLKSGGPVGVSLPEVPGHSPGL